MLEVIKHVTAAAVAHQEILEALEASRVAAGEAAAGKNPEYSGARAEEALSRALGARERIRGMRSKAAATAKALAEIIDAAEIAANCALAMALESASEVGLNPTAPTT